MVGERRGGRNLFLLLGAVVFALLSSIAIPTVTVAAAESDSSSNKIDKEDEEGVCKWEDEEGEKKCKEEAHRRNKDPYLPESSGGRDYFDDDNSKNDNEYGGYYHEDDDDDEDEDDHDEQYYNSFKHVGYGYDREEYEDKPEEGEEWDVWKHGGKGEIYTEMMCPDYDYDDSEMFKDTSFEKIHNAEIWQTFNKIYNEVIAATNDNDKKLRQESTIPPKFDKHGFQFPIEIKFRPVVGRGVYAKTDIPKGSLLYISTNNAAFHNGQTFRNFLKALPAKLACDVQIWAFVRWVSLETAHNAKHMVCVDLDEGSFVNSADVVKDYNMALGNDDGKMYLDMDENEEEQQELWYGCKMKFYASRDIAAGEEIRAYYGDFVETNGWMFLGL
jgi:hypothetical protein